MKSGSSSRARHSLSRALKRAGWYWEVSEDDIKYAWAADNEKGIVPRGTTPQDYREYFVDKVNLFHHVWTLSDEKRRPIGWVGGLDLPVGADGSELNNVTVIYAEDWAPWASPRQIITSSLNFIHRERKNRDLMWFSNYENKRFNETFCKYGIARRAGTTHQKEKLSIFESVRPKK